MANSDPWFAAFGRIIQPNFPHSNPNRMFKLPPSTKIASTKIASAFLFVLPLFVAVSTVGCGSDEGTTVIEQPADAAQQIDDYESSLREADENR